MRRLKVSVFGGGDWTQEGTFWRLGHDVGVVLAREGADVVTGGYGGAMEAVCEGAVQAEGHTIGVLHTSPNIHPPNRFVQEHIIAQDYLDRMAHLLRVPFAVALPGSSGTLAEITMSLALLQRRGGRSLAIYAPYWKARLLPLFQEISPGAGGDRLFWWERPEELREWLSGAIYDEDDSA